MKNKNASRISIIAGLIVELSVGIIYVWSVFKADAMVYYGWTDGAANLVASFMLFSFCAGNLFGGSLNDRIGPKKASYMGVVLYCLGLFLASFLKAGSAPGWFYLTYCILGGVGVGSAYGAVLSCIQKWFPHKRGFATGLSMAAFGLGTVIFSPIITALLKQMTISQTLRLIAIGAAIIGLACCTLVRLPDAEYLASLPVVTKKTTAVTARSLSLGEALKTIPIWCLFFSTFFYNGTWTMLNPLIKGLGMTRGLTENTAVLCVSLTGLFNAAGRFTMASLSDILGRTRTIIMLSVLTIICALFLISAGGALYFVIVLLTAFGFGGPSSVNPAATTDFYGEKYSGSNYGFVMLGLGFSSLFFNSVSNVLYASTGKYTMTFLMGAASAAIAIILMLVINHVQRKAAAGR